MTDNEIRNKVKEIIHANMISGHSKSVDADFHYTKPSPGTYPYQFFWDTCFHVFILNAMGEHEMAKKHLISLFALQEENGFVGHMIYWERILPGRLVDIFQSKPSLKLFQSHMSALVQPPLVAQAVLKTFRETNDLAFLSSLLPKLKKYYHWLAENRDFEGNGLLSIISPFESGMDWKPTYDTVVGFPEKKADYRLFWKVVSVDFRNFLHNYDLKTIYDKDYFIVKDAGFNTIYVQNLQAMAAICTIVNDPDAEYYDRLAKKVIQSILEVMYDAKSAAFYDVYGKNNKKIKILTPTVFFPVVINGIPEAISKKVIETHFFNKKEFDAPFTIPSVAMDHPSFNPHQSIYIWRGPTWVVHNWFMHQFLMEKGLKKEASQLVTSIKKLIRKSGFREYYNPFTGEGYGAQDFTWAGLVVDMMNMEEE